MDELGLDVHRLGWDVPVLTAGDPVGEIRPELSARLGLPKHLIVAQGVMDSYATALAGNIYRPGQLVASIGTSSSYIATTDRLTCDSRLLGPIERILPGLGPVQRGGQTSAAAAIAWFRQTFAPTHSYAEFDALASAVPPGARGVGAVESLHGSRTPHRNPAATGMFTGLTLGHGQAELFRAMLEAVAFGGRSVVDALTEAGCEADQVLAVGGGMRSALWRQIHADVLGMQLRTLATDQPVCLGAAMCAAAGAGVVASLSDAAATMSVEGEKVEPDPAAVDLYRQLYPDYVRRAALMASEGGIR
jgi:xylulokinase